MSEGLLMVYTGNGEGKTFAALGQVIRALGRGLKVCVIKFIFSGCEYQELMSLNEFDDALDFRDLTNEFQWVSGDNQQDRREFAKALESTKNTIQSSKSNLIVLCGLADLMKSELADVNEVLDLLLNRPPHLHLVVTGTYTPLALIEAADLVTEINATKYGGQTDLQ